MPILDFFLKGFIGPTIGMLEKLVNDMIFFQAFQQIFFFERLIGLDDTVYSRMNALVALFASGLLLLKFLHKLLSIYVLRVDGDDTVSPMGYLRSFIKGLVLISTFTIAYGWIYEIVRDFGEKMLTTIGTQKWEFSGTALTVQIFTVIYLIMVCVIYIHLLMGGVRLFILRMGMPFACIGLVDNDNGLYSVFLKKIFQTASTILVQMVLIQLSMLPFTYTDRVNDILSSISGGGLDGNPFSIMASIAILVYSFKVTQDLNEVFLTSAASGAGSKLQSAGMGVQTIMGLFRK